MSTSTSVLSSSRPIVRLGCVVAAVVVTATAACGDGTGPGPELISQTFEYDLSGTFDTSIGGYWTQNPEIKFYYETTSVPRTFTGSLHLDAMDPPAGKLSWQETERNGRSFSWESLVTGTTRAGNAVTMVFGFSETAANPKTLLTGTLDGDSLYGTIYYRFATSTTAQKWGRFVARRRP
jgi:hypothetical protein